MLRRFIPKYDFAWLQGCLFRILLLVASMPQEIQVAPQAEFQGLMNELLILNIE